MQQQQQKQTVCGNESGSGNVCLVLEGVSELESSLIKETAMMMAQIIFEKGGVTMLATSPKMSARQIGGRATVCFHNLQRITRSMLEYNEWHQMNPKNRRCIVSIIYDATDHPGVLVATLTSDEHWRTSSRHHRNRSSGQKPTSSSKSMIVDTPHSSSVIPPVAVDDAASSTVKSTVSEPIQLLLPLQVEEASAKPNMWMRSVCGGWTHFLSAMTIVIHGHEKRREIIEIPIVNEAEVREINGMLPVATFLAAQVLAGCIERRDIACEVKMVMPLFAESKSQVAAAAAAAAAAATTTTTTTSSQSSNTRDSGTNLQQRQGAYYAVRVTGAKKFGARSLGSNDMWIPGLPSELREGILMKYDCATGCHMLRVNTGDQYMSIASYVSALCNSVCVNVENARFGFEVPCMCTHETDDVPSKGPAVNRKRTFNSDGDNTLPDKKRQARE